MQTRAAVDFDAELDRLDRLHQATGDPRLAAAIEALSADGAADRDHIVHEMAQQHASDCWSIRAKAAKLDHIARRYLAGAWLRGDRDRLRMPAALAGKPEGFVWRVAKATGGFPGYERLRTILNNG